MTSQQVTPDLGLPTGDLNEEFDADKSFGTQLLRCDRCLRTDGTTDIDSLLEQATGQPRELAERL